MVRRETTERKRKEEESSRLVPVIEDLNVSSKVKKFIEQEENPVSDRKERHEGETDTERRDPKGEGMGLESSTWEGVGTGFKVFAKSGGVE